ncbi:hypothetical protein Y032_0240g3346 [Ancylostoma ceylanicum]|uniref:Uncharacterized protein n=1 Tax=Ancylostoma ceylanicum TaxID=53326 RepID=A0A016SEZ0_9BILA|nr:hypothetical protein Y032_0240g3346 [Ancylostoma ceylanicum]
MVLNTAIILDMMTMYPPTMDSLTVPTSETASPTAAGSPRIIFCAERTNRPSTKRNALRSINFEKSE